MARERKQRRIYELDWRFVPRIATEHFGSQKYSTSAKALRELVANALDAGATVVRIEILENKLGGVESITISDNGKGISPEELQERFVVVGVEPSTGRNTTVSLGRFGVGRLAVHRIGTLSQWTTISRSKTAGRIQSSFTLSADLAPLKVEEESVPDTGSLGTTIQIFNIRDTGKERLTAVSISNDLLSHFCSFLLANPSRQILVQGEALNVNDMVSRSERETLLSDLLPQEATINHLLLHRSVDQSRFPAQIIFSGKGRTVAAAQSDDIPSPNYLGIIECAYLDSIVTSNRDLLIEMDGTFAELKNLALERIRRFGEQLHVDRSRSFIEQVRQEDYYPYRNPPRDAVTEVQQAVYDVVLSKINEAANIAAMNKRQQAVVIRLLKRSLDNENVLDVLEEVAKLSDEDMEKFRKVLERTTLDSIIRLSSEVTNRIAFLDVLHQLVYGLEAKHLKERSQLHRILEPHCWLFGPQFHLATSDKGFRKVIRQHRLKVGIESIGDDELQNIQGINDIPDLFLAAVRDFPVEPKHHHVLVELKAPSVSLGRKEVDQIRQYAETIMNSPQFDKQSTRWDLFLVSAKATNEIERDRKQKEKPYGCLWDWEGMTVWAFQWSEIISKARDEMYFVRDHLKKKSEELTVSDYLRENFPEILAGLSDRLEQSMKDVALSG